MLGTPLPNEAGTALWDVLDQIGPRVTGPTWSEGD